LCSNQNTQVIWDRGSSNFKKIVQCMKTSRLVIDTFLYLFKNIKNINLEFYQGIRLQNGHRPGISAFWG
jgi:hypothetical protein